MHFFAIFNSGFDLLQLLLITNFKKNSGDKTKPKLLLAIIKALKVTPGDVEAKIKEFMDDTAELNNESLVTLQQRKRGNAPFGSYYKQNFNWEDVFDHLFANIDSKVRFNSKEARLFEISYYYGVVCAWTTYAELKIRERFKTPLSYVTALARNPHLKPAELYPIKTFMRDLALEMLAEASS